MGGDTSKDDTDTAGGDGHLAFDGWADETPDALAYVMGQMQTVENAARTQFLRCVLAYSRSGAWRDDGARNMAAWLVQTFAYNPSTAREYVTVADKLAELPEITAAFEAGLLCWDKVRTLCTFATTDTDAELAAAAPGWSHSELRREAASRRRVTIEDAALRRERRSLRLAWDYDGGLLHLSGCLADIDGATFATAIRHRAGELRRDDKTMTSPQSCADALVSLVTGDRPPKIELVVVARQPPSPEAADAAFIAKGPAIDPATVERLAGHARIRHVQGELPSGAHDMGRRSRRPIVALVRDVLLRDNWQCGFKGCYSDGWLELHHFQAWSEGGPTDAQNLGAYCSHHHGLFDKGFTVEIGPDGSRITRKPDGTIHNPKPPQPSQTIRELLESLGIIPRRE